MFYKLLRNLIIIYMIEIKPKTVNPHLLTPSSLFSSSLKLSYLFCFLLAVVLFLFGLIYVKSWREEIETKIRRAAGRILRDEGRKERRKGRREREREGVVEDGVTTYD